MRVQYAVPVAIFALVALLLGAGLYLNPREIPSALIGRPVPSFQLPPLPGHDPGFSSADLKEGQVVLVNVFATWCVPCRAEHPILLELSKRHEVPIFAIDYKDDPKMAEAWLAEFGNPYSRIGMDKSGRVGIDWGVYGVPETYVIDRTGNIAFKQVGPLTADDMEQKILPLIRQLKARG
ncbi:MAG TPA: DsbE family thiol:disulfide interchange protein [Candidatus Cybelea sp.]|nr:DsbE family thiol:disulfide interchange protein [Candidatus Cybelea sp.]